MQIYEYLILGFFFWGLKESGQDRPDHGFEMFLDGVVDELRIAKMRVIELIDIFPAVEEEKLVFIFLLR